MSREQSLHRGAALMVLGALIFLVYAVVFFFRAFSSTGFELGVETLNGVTRRNETAPPQTMFRSSWLAGWRHGRDGPRCRIAHRSSAIGSG
jgi:ribosome modulation factor